MRVVVLSDIHSNLAALEAVMAEVGSVDAVWCLGDVVGYGAEPNECIGRLREAGVRCIAGNHDWAAISRAPIDDFSAEAAAAAIWTAGALTAESREWLEALPEVIVEASITLAHGSPYDPIWEYVTSARVAARSLAYFETPGCLIGHTHLPSSFVEREDGSVAVEYREAGDELLLDGGRLLANPGSVGQPRDQDPRAAYLIFDSDAGRLSWRRVEYPIEQTQEKIPQAGLPPRLAHRLALGR